MAGLLNPQRSGLLGGSPTMIRQIMTPGTPGTGAPFMGGSMMGGMDEPAARGTDEWALQNFGPGGLLWRQIIGGMATSKNPLSVLDPSKAGKYYTDDTIGLLSPRIQRGYKKASK